MSVSPIKNHSSPYPENSHRYISSHGTGENGTTDEHRDSISNGATVENREYTHFINRGLGIFRSLSSSQQEEFVRYGLEVIYEQEIERVAMFAWVDEQNVDVDGMIERLENVAIQTREIRQQTKEIIEQTDRMIEQSKEINGQTDRMIEQSKEINEQTDGMIEQSQEIIKRTDKMIEQSSRMIAETREMRKQTEEDIKKSREGTKKLREVFQSLKSFDETPLLNVTAKVIHFGRERMRNMLSSLSNYCSAPPNENDDKEKWRRRYTYGILSVTSVFFFGMFVVLLWRRSHNPSHPEPGYWRLVCKWFSQEKK